MDRLKKYFGVDFAAGQPAYFQVSKKRKIVIPFEFFSHNPSLLKFVVSELFKTDSQIDSTFLYSYRPNSQTRLFRFSKGSIRRSFNITNWKEDLRTSDEFGDTLTYVTIADVNIEEIIHYANSLLRCMRSLYIGFYNESHFLQIDQDELVIVCRNEELADILRLSFKMIFTKLHEKGECE